MMREPAHLSHVEFLVNAKYPAFRTLNRDAYYIGMSDELADLEWRAAIFRDKLKGMPPDRVRRLNERFKKWRMRYRDKYKAHIAELRQRLEDGFTRSLKAQFDYEYWVKMPFWTSAEAAALMLEISPEAGGRLEGMSSSYAIIQEHRKLCELIRRAELAGQMDGESHKITPAAYTRWAKLRGLALPAELENHIAHLSNSQDVRYGKSADLKPLSTRERETLYKILFGMAHGGYGYDPRAGKSSIVKEIHDDLALRGIALDQDTIRNKLKEASRLITLDTLEPNS